MQSNAWNWDCRFVSISRLSQIQTDCLLRINSSTAILNYLKLFESILGIVTTLTKKYWYFTLLKAFIYWYVMYLLYFINDECITWQFRKKLDLFRALNACFNYFWSLYLNFQEINIKLEIETSVRLRHCSLNLRRSTVPCSLKTFKINLHRNFPFVYSLLIPHLAWIFNKIENILNSWEI